MGFGKWVLGGVCAVGAVVAAPVVLPTAGLATLVTSGVAGVAAGSLYERQMEKARDEGRRESQVSVSNAYEEKMRNQEQAFKSKIKEEMGKMSELKKKLAEYKEKEKLTQEEIEERDRLIDEMQECINNLEKEFGREDGSMTAFASGYIVEARELISAFG